jgi:hypothetical protein
MLVLKVLVVLAANDRRVGWSYWVISSRVLGSMH